MRCSYLLNIVTVLLYTAALLPAMSNAQSNASQPFTPERISKTLVSMYQSLIKQNISSLIGRLPLSLLSQPSIGNCIRDLSSLTSNDRRSYIDAAGKPHSGLFVGNTFWPGSVMQCQTISNSHYCLSWQSITLSANFTTPSIAWGICFPASCDTNATNILLRYMIFPMVKQAANINVQFHGAVCPTKQTYSKGVIVSLVLSGIVLFLCLIGTIVEIIIEARNTRKTAEATFCERAEISIQEKDVAAPQPMSFVENGHLADNTMTSRPLSRFVTETKEAFCNFTLCFSLVRNTKKIFDTNVPPTAITSINGIRVISIFWVTLGHTFLNFISSIYVEGKFQLLEDTKSLSAMPVFNAYYSVDSFFFLSGLLVAYTCMRKLQKSNGNFNWVLFYVHRFLRLTPSYMYVIVFATYLSKFLSNGPIYTLISDNKPCKDYWWTNLLYINNFHPGKLDDQCIGWSWYLANDMQFYVITPPLLYILYKFGWRGLSVPLALFGMSSIAIASIFGHYHLDALGAIKYHDPSPELADVKQKALNYVYIKPYCRIQPYLIGFILGYAMHVNSQRMQRPGWIVTFVGWASAAIIGMGLVYGPHKSTLPGARKWSEAENILYGMFDRALWGLMLAWVTYACHYKAGGLVQKFLSAKFWIPLSRLTYSVYLMHLVVLSVMLNGPTWTIHYDTFTVSYYFISAVVLSYATGFILSSYYFISAVVLSYATGFILSVCIEYPCDNLENLAIKSIRSRLKSRSRKFVVQ